MKGNIFLLATEAAEAAVNTAMSGAVALRLLVYFNSFSVGPPRGPLSRPVVGLLCMQCGEQVRGVPPS
jgi:hypothetical protein